MAKLIEKILCYRKGCDGIMNPINEEGLTLICTMCKATSGAGVDNWLESLENEIAVQLDNMANRFRISIQL